MVSPIPNYLDLALSASAADVAHVGTATGNEINEINELSGISPEHDAPDEWAVGVAALRCMPPPAMVSQVAWTLLVADAQAFLAEWGGVAAALGWSAYDVFGVHPTRPLIRYDYMGLIPLIRGRAVVALTADEAAIETPRGQRLVYRRHKDQGEMPDRVLLWELR